MFPLKNLNEKNPKNRRRLIGAVRKMKDEQNSSIQPITKAICHVLTRNGT